MNYHYIMNDHDGPLCSDLSELFLPHPLSSCCWISFIITAFGHLVICLKTLYWLPNIENIGSELPSLAFLVLNLLWTLSCTTLPPGVMVFNNWDAHVLTIQNGPDYRQPG